MFTLTGLHVVISLLAIVAGAIALFQLLTGKSRSAWTAVFLAASIATSATGFLFFPLRPTLPSHVVGLVSLVVLAVAVVALYVHGLRGAWRWMYVIAAVTALYLNVFVGVVQAFLRFPGLNALAPTQSEPPFVATQLAVLAFFVGVAVAGLRRVRPGLS